MKRLHTTLSLSLRRVLCIVPILCLPGLPLSKAQADIVHVAAASNTRGADLYLQGDTVQQQILMATPVWNIGGVGGVYDNHNIGVIWDSFARQWAVFNQDNAAMPMGAAFNVWAGAASNNIYTHVAATGGLFGRPGNVTGNSTYLDNAYANGNPYAQVFVTPDWSPSGFAGVTLNHPIGVWYDTYRQRWAIFNQDGAAMPNGAAFSVLIWPTPNCFTHQATASLVGQPGNIVSNWTYLDNPLTNGNSNAYLFVTPNWNPGGRGGVYNNHPIGVWYDTYRQKWAVFNQDKAAMPVGACFNVWVIPENGDLASLKLDQSFLLCQLPYASTAATVTLDYPAPEGGATVAVSSSNSAIAWTADASGHPIGSITIPAGAQTGNFWVYTSDTSPTSVTFTASYRGVSRQAALTIGCF